MDAPNLYRIILMVSDIDQAANFYTSLLGINGQRVSSGRHYFKCGATLLACFDPQADGDNLVATPNPNYIYFGVDDLEAVHKRAKSLPCKRVDEHIALKPWGERLFYAQDPFGNPICFVDSSTLFTGNG